jgi:PAS domain S-box-containing protein
MHYVTLQIEVEAALRESEGRFRQLADSMPQLVWTARPDGTVDYYNQRSRLYSGFRMSEDGSWEWQPVLHPEDIQATSAAWQAALEKETTYQCEHRALMADGSYRWHLSRGIPAHDEQGQLVKWYGTATDIHDLKQAQAELAEYTEKLKRSNEELESFAFVASHDLQEPLRKIKLFSEGLRRRMDVDLPEEAEDYISRMQSAADRMQAMVNGLLDLSRVSTRGRTFTAVNLSRVAEEVLSDLEVRLRSTQGQVLVEPLPVALGDAMQLQQLLQNLIGNALKFHRVGVPPVVRVSGAKVKVGVRWMVKLEVEDNGIGFESAHEDEIFQPFVRLQGRSAFEGNGIGLAICRKIVERHGGSIAASSQVGKGSKFTVMLPAFIEEKRQK